MKDVRPGVLLAWLGAAACDGCSDAPIAEAIQPVARCTATAGDVRRRLISSAAWRTLGTGTDLFAGDWVQTAERSTAAVEYEGGAEILVEPSSTIVIQALSGDDRSQVRRIAVKSGRVQGRIKGEARRKVAFDLPNGRTIQVEAKSEDAGFRVDVAEDGRADVSVTQGAAQVVAGDGVPREAAAGTVVRVKEEGASAPQPLPPTPSAPLAARDQVYAGDSVLLRWSGASGVGYRVEFAEDPDFRRRIGEIQTPNEEIEYEPEGPGTVYFRVYARDGEGLVSLPSRTGSLRVAADDRPRLLQRPADGATFQIARGSARVTFSWKEPRSSGPYRLVVSESKDLSDPVLDRRSDALDATDAFGPGTYHWGVYDAGGDALFATPYEFQVVRKELDLQVPPKLRWKRPEGR